MSDGPFISDISSRIWDIRYRYRESGKIIDLTVEDTWRRVARALAEVERQDKEIWEQRFYQVLEGFRFLPGGRIQAGAGTGHRVTLFNCFVMGDDRGFARRHFRGAQGRRAHHAAGRRCRLRFLHPAAERRRRPWRRRHRLRAGVVHADLGQHVRHHPFHRRAPRRDDGDAALRPPGYRGFSSRAKRDAACAAAFQSVGAGERRLHAARCGPDARLAAGVSALPRVNRPGRSWNGRGQAAARPRRCRVLRTCRRARRCGTRSCGQPTITPSRA